MEKYLIDSYGKTLAFMRDTLRQRVGIGGLTSYTDHMRRHIGAPINSQNFWQYREFTRHLTEHDGRFPFDFITERGYSVNLSDFSTTNTAYRAAQVLMQTWPRLSEKDPCLVSYYMSVEDAKRGKRTAGKLGRYLTRFWGWHFTEEQISDIANKHRALHLPPTLKITSDPDEIERVYTNGPHSCMAYGPGHFACDIHPARVYGGGDTAVAYLELEDGRITARSVVIPKDKYYTRCYGNDAVLQQLLQAQGYTERRDGLNGYRVKAIRSGHRLVMPYLDWCQNADYDDGDEYVHISHDGDFACDNTDGTADWPDDRRVCCACCDEPTEPDDLCTVHNDVRVCDYCYGEHYVEAVISRRGYTADVHRDNCFYVDDTETYYAEWLDDEDLHQAGIARCVTDDEYYAVTNLVIDHHGDYIRADEAIEVDGEYYHQDDDDRPEEPESTEEPVHGPEATPAANAYL